MLRIIDKPIKQSFSTHLKIVVMYFSQREKKHSPGGGMAPFATPLYMYIKQSVITTVIK